MPFIEISDEDFEKLQRVAVPLVDTAATAFARVIDHYGSTRELLHAAGSDEAFKVPSFDPASLPPMLHTKLVEGTFNGQAPSRMNWDGLVQLALTDLVGAGCCPAEVKSVSTANVVAGIKVSEGYKQLPGSNFSYQGVSAEHAVRIISLCSVNLGCAVQVLFRWLSKDAAHCPGGYGRIAFPVRKVAQPKE